MQKTIMATLIVLSLAFAGLTTDAASKTTEYDRVLADIEAVFGTPVPAEVLAALEPLRNIPALTPGQDANSDVGVTARPTTNGPYCVGGYTAMYGTTAPNIISAGTPSGGTACGQPTNAGVVFTATSDVFGGNALSDQWQNNPDGTIIFNVDEVTVSGTAWVTSYDYGWAYLTIAYWDTGVIQTV